ncbi:hypothetical protein AGMMS4956_12690 [Bacteroidia bacterium]|nr:hypothetical protein AGMMS4956_12690 [Bacteroidia bacterium]
MNKFFSCSKIVAVCLLLVASLTPAFGRQKVAVYVTGNNNAPENKIIASKLVAAITTDGYYEAVERTAAFLDQIQKEQEYQQGGAVADDQLSKLGQQMGVDYVCIAEVVPLGRAFFISARLVNVETAGVEVTADATCENPREINSVVASANELAAKLVNPDAVVASAPKASVKETPQAAPVVIPKDKSVSDFTDCGCEIKVTDMGKQTFNNMTCPKGWRVPTLNELSCMCQNEDKIGGFSVGMFKLAQKDRPVTMEDMRGSTAYWSSESVDAKKAYVINFKDCKKDKEKKGAEARVRCVRESASDTTLNDNKSDNERKDSRRPSRPRM